MPERPTVVYVEKAYTASFDDMNPTRDALAFILRKDLGCDVALYTDDYALREDLERLQNLAESGTLIAAIVAQDEYCDERVDAAVCFRKDISGHIPVVVIPNQRADIPYKASAEEVSIRSHGDPALFAFIEAQVQAWNARNLAATQGTVSEQSMREAQLERAYDWRDRTDDGAGMLGTPDRNHKIVAEHIRIRLTPSPLLAEEFDASLMPDAPREFLRAEPSVYEAEEARIRALNDDERLLLEHTLLRMENKEPAPGGGIYVRQASCGPNVNGFAMDPETGEWLETHRFGQHHLAAEMLGYRIEYIEMLRAARTGRRDDAESRYARQRRIVAGLIFSSVPGFTTPLLRLYAEDSDTLQRVAAAVRARGAYIPIDHDGDVIV